MTALTFDTHFFIKKLINDGIPEKQAEAIVEFVRETREVDFNVVATKSDIKELRSEIRELELRLTVKLGGMIMALGAILIAIKYFG